MNKVSFLKGNIDFLLHAWCWTEKTNYFPNLSSRVFTIMACFNPSNEKLKFVPLTRTNRYFQKHKSQIHFTINLTGHQFSVGHDGIVRIFSTYSIDLDPYIILLLCMTNRSNQKKICDLYLWLLEGSIHSLKQLIPIYSMSSSKSSRGLIWKIKPSIVSNKTMLKLTYLMLVFFSLSLDLLMFKLFAVVKEESCSIEPSKVGFTILLWIGT